MKAEYHSTELQTTMSSVEDSLCTYNRGIQGEKHPFACGRSFKWEPKTQLEGSGWITTSFVLMCCGHQIASLSLLPPAPQRALGSYGWLKTNTPVLRDSSSLVSGRI